MPDYSIWPELASNGVKIMTDREQALCYGDVAKLKREYLERYKISAPVFKRTFSFRGMVRDWMNAPTRAEQAFEEAKKEHELRCYERDMWAFNLLEQLTPDARADGKRRLSDEEKRQLLAKLKLNDVFFRSTLIQEKHKARSRLGAFLLRFRGA